NKEILANSVNSKVIQDFINTLESNEYSQKIIQDFFSIVRNILKFGQKKYKLKEISYLEDVVIPKKAPTREEIKAKRENYLELQQVKQIVDEINDMAIKKNAGYMRHAYLMCAYIAEFQALNGMRIGELLAIQHENINIEKKKLTIDGTILWERNGSEYGFKDTTKNESSYRTISITSRSVQILNEVITEIEKL